MGTKTSEPRHGQTPFRPAGVFKGRARIR